MIKRADIWAFGCVLYEMLSATYVRPFPDVNRGLWGVGGDRRAGWRGVARRTIAGVRVEQLGTTGSARL
ncbi:MAG: hypothetical protein ACRD2A_03775 [Vicinamibacterales bacterium]